MRDCYANKTTKIGRPLDFSADRHRSAGRGRLLCVELHHIARADSVAGDAGAGCQRHRNRERRRPDEPAYRPSRTIQVEDGCRDPIAGFIRLATHSALVLISTGMVLGIGAGVWMSRRMTAPLESLAKGAAEIGRGDLGVRVAPRGSIEMIALADAFNHMAADLQTAEQLRQHLLADVAHELRTPLTVLQGNLRAILDNVYPLDKEEIARLYEQTRHLHRLTNDLHELAQAEAKRLPLHLQPVNLAVLVQEVVETFAPLADLQEIALTVAFLDGDAVIQADRARLVQVMHNLLVNALHHTPAGGSIIVAVRQDDQSTTITVQDSGEGIDPEHLSHVFDRFYRTDWARDRDAGGAGLGLAIVRALVEAQSGTVSVASRGNGTGSTFTVRFPASIRSAQR